MLKKLVKLFHYRVVAVDKHQINYPVCFFETTWKLYFNYSNSNSLQQWNLTGKRLKIFLILHNHLSKLLNSTEWAKSTIKKCANWNFISTIRNNEPLKTLFA